MKNKNSKIPIKKSVIDKIKGEKIKMHSRSYFIFRIILLIISSIIILSALVYLISFVIFMLRESGLLFMPAFGFQGIGILFSNFPWFLILISIFFIALLEIFVKKYGFAYRKPLLYSVLIIITFVILIGFIIQKSSFHRNILEKVEEGRFPVGRPLYDDFGMRKPKNVHPGIISEVSQGGFIMKKRDGNFVTIEISTNTNFPEGKDIKQGDHVVVLGEIKNNIIKAEGVNKVPKGNIFVPPPTPSGKEILPPTREVPPPPM